MQHSQRRRGVRGPWAVSGALLLACPVWLACSPLRSSLADSDLAGPPMTRRGLTEDDYHGQIVEDPYRWLEDQDSPEVLAWASRQNEWTEAHLERVPSRPALRRRMLELWNQPRFGLPIRRGDRWFFSKNNGLQNQAVIYVAGAPDADGEVLLDPNTLSEDGTVALADWVPSRDGRQLAFALSESGSDWREWFVLDTATRERRTDRLQWSKFSSVAWTPDGAGFFYQRYPAPGSGEVFEASNHSPQLCYHRVGTSQSEDEVVYERPDEPEWGFATRVTEDGRFAIVSIWSGTDRRNRVAYIELEDDTHRVRPLLMDFDASYEFIGNNGSTFFFLTDDAAPNGRIVAIEATDPDRGSWREIVASRPETIESVELLGGQFVALMLRDAQHAIERFTIDGEQLTPVPLPGIGSVAGLVGRADDSRMFYSFESFTRSRSIESFDLASGEHREVRPSATKVDLERFETEMVSLQARDGTRLLMFLVHRRGIVLDGSHPTYLYGYGGFNIALTPRYSVPNLVWVERGGIYAHAILRGGGEFGERWHAAGMLESKQNVFDDFVDCAQYLLRNGYTSPERLAIGGRSNGGLLVGAVLNQRPELFGAAIPEVGVLDMLRYHEFTIGRAWAPEYGRSDDPVMFPILRAYSPLHNVRDDIAYPPTMVMTGDHDDRVLPGHSYKFAATLQRAQPNAPVLLRVQSRSGHGAGKPVRMQVEEAADRWAFLDWALGPP